VQKLTFTNARGESVTFGNSKPFILSHIDGVGGAPTDIRTVRSPYQDGSSVVGVQMSDRPIHLQGAIMARSREEMYALRRDLSRVLNPRIGAGKLIYTNDARSYFAPAIAEESPVWGDRFSDNQLFTASFLCPDPFWRDINETVKDLKFASGGMSFPLRLPTLFSFSSYRGVFNNDGDVEAPVLIHYQGPAQNPVVLNETTGEMIKVNRILSPTDVLQINTAFGKKRVEIVAADGTRTNVFNWIDLSSTFFSLVPGQNVLKYSSDNENDTAAARVTVYWTNRYAGG